jgi:hypothetical protein
LGRVEHHPRHAAGLTTELLLERALVPNTAGSALLSSACSARSGDHGAFRGIGGPLPGGRIRGFQALIATAAGLAAAIPAIVAYQLLYQPPRVLNAEMENFASEFLDVIRRHFEGLTSPQSLQQVQNLCMVRELKAES